MDLRSVELSLLAIVVGLLPFFGLGIFLSWLWSRHHGSTWDIKKDISATDIAVWTIISLLVVALFDTLVLTYTAQGLWRWVRLTAALTGVGAFIFLGFQYSIGWLLKRVGVVFGGLVATLWFVVIMYAPLSQQWVTSSERGVTIYHMIPDVARHILYTQEKNRADYGGSMRAPNAYPERVGSYYFGMHSVMSLLTWYQRSFQPSDYLAAFLVFQALVLYATVMVLFKSTKSVLFLVSFLAFIFIWNAATNPGEVSLFAWFSFNPSSFAHFATIAGLVFALFYPRCDSRALLSVAILSAYAQATKPPSLFLNILPLIVVIFRFSMERIAGWQPRLALKKFLSGAKKLRPLMFTVLPLLFVFLVQQLTIGRDPLHRSIVFYPRDIIHENELTWNNWTKETWFIQPWRGLANFLAQIYPDFFSVENYSGLNDRTGSFILLGVIMVIAAVIIILFFQATVRFVLRLRNHQSHPGGHLPPSSSLWTQTLVVFFMLLLGYLAPILFAVKGNDGASWDGLFNSMQQSLHLFGVAVILLLFRFLTAYTRASLSNHPSTSKKKFWRLLAAPAHGRLAGILLLMLLAFSASAAWKVSTKQPLQFSNFTINIGPKSLTYIRTIPKHQLNSLVGFQGELCPAGMVDDLQMFASCVSPRGPYWYYR